MGEADPTLSDLFEHSPCGLLATSPHGQLLAVNATLAAWLGYTADELVGRMRFQGLLGVQGRIFYDTHIAPLLRMQGFVHEIAVELVSRSSRMLPVLISCNERRDASGGVQSIRIAVFQAVDRRKYERELVLARRMAEQAMKAKADFLAVFAHEVRNALGTVHLGVQTLGHTGVAPAGERTLAMVRLALDRVLSLLQNMLDFSKVEAGKMELERRRFDVRELVHGVVQTLEPIAERKRLPVHVDVDERVPEHLVGDGVKIGQVIANLVGNAIKFTQSGSVSIRVTLEGWTCAERNAVLRFSVADTGSGIAPDRIPTIFDEYTQVGSSHGGAGLGLAISQRIIKLHGSKLEIESQPGKGTVLWFVLSLPIGDGDEPDALR